MPLAERRKRRTLTEASAAPGRVRWRGNPGRDAGVREGESHNPTSASTRAVQCRCMSHAMGHQTHLSIAEKVGLEEYHTD